MNWYELDWKLQDSNTISHSLDGYTRDRNMREILTLFKQKITEIECNGTVMQSSMNGYIQTELNNLREENELMKQLLVKIIQKDYPEIVLEQPEFISANLEKQALKHITQLV